MTVAMKHRVHAVALFALMAVATAPVVAFAQGGGNLRFHTSLASGMTIAGTSSMSTARHNGVSGSAAQSPSGTTAPSTFNTNQSIASSIGTRLGTAHGARVGGRIGGGSNAALPLDPRTLDPRDALELKIKAMDAR